MQFREITDVYFLSIPIFAPVSYCCQNAINVHVVGHGKPFMFTDLIILVKHSINNYMIKLYFLHLKRVYFNQKGCLLFGYISNHNTVWTNVSAIF